ncbi:MAG TPA: hypothetical protein VMW62_17540 [Chloroflexota bacterium]|nr:hypothetical protein [Chloroflexota bacterium]
MASPFQDPAVTADRNTGSVPPQAPALTNPPATLEQIAYDHADRARAAVGGAAAAGRPRREQAEAPRLPHPPRGDRLRRSPRFEPPPEVDFEFTPPTSQQIPNSNLPLTIGLLFSIVASFVIFFVSLAAASSGGDPIMPAFWRALGALAVLITLSFAASWFMPSPQDHHQLLDQLDAQDRALGRYQAPARSRQEPSGLHAAAFPDYEEDNLDMGRSIDVTVQDDGFGDDDDLVMAQPEDEDYFDDDEDDDLTAMSRNSMAGADAAAFGTGQ